MNKEPRPLAPPPDWVEDPDYDPDYDPNLDQFGADRDIYGNIKEEQDEE
jgi:hypothetical protein